MNFKGKKNVSQKKVCTFLFCPEIALFFRIFLYILLMFVITQIITFSHILKGFLVSRLAKLIEQTTYLLSKQYESQTQIEALFGGLLSFIEKSAESKPEAHKDRLMEVYELLAKRSESMNHYAQEDVDFLKDQLKALESIQQIKDPKIAAEMLEALVDEDEEVLETAEFKQQLDEELDQSRQVLAAVVEDIKDAVDRGDLSETEILIESMLEAEDMDDEDEDEDDEDYDDEDEDEDDEDEDDTENRRSGKKKGGCGDCSGGCGPKGCGGCSASGDGDVEDFFSFMGKYDKDLTEDLEEDEDEKDDCCDDDEEEDECCKK